MADALIYEAIPALLADVDAIGKTRKNQQQGYNFRGIDEVYNMVHPLLAKHKVFPTCEIVSTSKEERQTKSGGVLFYVTLKAKYTFWATDGSSVVSESLGEAMDSGDKATNKAMSAAYKYALFQLLCIPTEAVDSEQESHDVAPKRTDVAPRKAQADAIAQQHGMTTADKLPAKKVPADPDGNFDPVGYYRKKINVEQSAAGLDAALRELKANKDSEAIKEAYPSLLYEWFQRAIECAADNDRVRYLDEVLAKAKGALGMIDGKDAFVKLGAALDAKYQKEAVA